MSQVHLSHIIDWSAISRCYFDLPGQVNLPVGPCDRIHLIDRETEIKVEYRSKYITEEMICKNDHCINEVKKSKDLIKYKLFKKETENPGHNNFPNLSVRKTSEQNYKSFLSFVRSWMEAISSFVDSDAHKFSQEAMEKIRENPPSDEFLKNLVRETIGIQDFSDDSVMYALFVSNNLPILKYLHDEKRINVNNHLYVETHSNFQSPLRYRELFRYNLSIYFVTNIMIKMKIKKIKPNTETRVHYFDRIIQIMKSMKSYDYHRNNYARFEIPLFLFPHLHHETLFIDEEKTGQLLKLLFRLLVNYFSMRRYIIKNDPEFIKQEILEEIVGILLVEIYSKEYQKLFARIAADLGIKIII